MRQRLNVGLIVIFGQALQITLVVVSLMVFFVVFGVLAIPADTVSSWTGLDDVNVLADFDVGDRTLVLTESLIRVAVFLGAFAGMYFTVVLSTDDTYRTEFAEDVGPEIRQALADARGLPGAPRLASVVPTRVMSDRHSTGEVRIELPRAADDMVAVVEVFDAVWGSTTPVVTVELLTAVAHGGGYVALARAATTAAPWARRSACSPATTTRRRCTAT